ncbi:endolytic transglycosylase MltG, partial [Candidatus Desantisbacteria bacterium]|nr:endolytic transglycosylase MltG [Candidatus Desantisbacteria bacterium]
MKNGEFKKHKITIPEGYTAIEIAEFLQQKKLADKDKFLKLINDEKILRKYRIEANSLEGYLFPDTYLFFKGITEEKIIINMLNRFFTIFNADYEKKTREAGLTRHEVIILASIVEKEAIKDNERAIIAAVFLNRLKKHMRLESCATVQYALKKHKDRLWEEDLKVESPYNTYLYHGLPKGPISSPGKASILAVLYPDNVKYLYFVSRNDGTHEFSNTFREHV